MGFGLGKAKKKLRRKIVTLEDLRREYAAELDRVQRIERGDYPFLGVEGEEMDVL